MDAHIFYSCISYYTIKNLSLIRNTKYIKILFLENLQCCKRGKNCNNLMFENPPKLNFFTIVNKRNLTTDDKVTTMYIQRSNDKM